MIDRTRIFDGHITTVAASAQSIELARLAMDHATRAFECRAPTRDLRAAHERFDPRAMWTRTCAARAAIAADVAMRDASIALAEALGFTRSKLSVDAVRLRVVAPRMHESPDAKRAFYIHRDTWYGSPRAQINAWIPLFDVDARDSFAIWKDAFGVRVENDSRDFDRARFEFQSATVADAAYPRALGAAPGEPLRISARACEVVAFSAAHLHATTPNETRFTRFSIDVRFVDTDDEARGLGAPDVDNASNARTRAEYLRVTT